MGVGVMTQQDVETLEPFPRPGTEAAKPPPRPSYVDPGMEHHLLTRDILAPDGEVYTVARFPLPSGEHNVVVSQDKDLTTQELHRSVCADYEAAVVEVKALVEGIEAGVYPSGSSGPGRA